jgi:hypothetical protein
MIKEGMELGCLANIDVKQNTDCHLEAIQTPPVNKDDTETGRIKYYGKIFSGGIDMLESHIQI